MAQLANRRSQMTFYSDATGPFSHSVRFVLAEKAINVDVINVEGNERPEVLNDLNPYDSVMTLVDRELVLYEEQIIMEYLDERFPHPPLMPVDPVSRATNRLYRYRIKRDILSKVVKLEEGLSGRAVTSTRKALKDEFTAIAPIFAQKPYFMSDEFSLVDAYLAPVLWRLPHYKVELPASAKPLLTYADKLFERESFQVSLSEAERDLREV